MSGIHEDDQVGEYFLKADALTIHMLPLALGDLQDLIACAPIMKASDVCSHSLKRCRSLFGRLQFTNRVRASPPLPFGLLDGYSDSNISMWRSALLLLTCDPSDDSGFVEGFPGCDRENGTLTSTN